MKMNRIIYGAAAACMMLGAFTACGDDDNGGSKSGGGAKSSTAAVKDLINAYNDHDAEKMLAKIYPAKLIKALKKEDKESYNMLLESIEDELDEVDEEYGDDWKMKIDRIDAEKMDDDDLDEWIEELEYYYDECGLDAPKITDGAYVSIDVDIESGDDSDSISADLAALKIDGSWYAQMN